MPGFVLEEAFPLARFNKKIGENDSRLFTVGIDALESVLEAGRDSDRSDIADNVAITVQGEGFKIYNTIDQKCTQSWISPPGVAFAGPATHQDGGRDPDSTDYTYAIVASSPDMPKQEQYKKVWLWKHTKNSDTDSADHITKTFEDRLHAIHISPTLQSHVILISENGSIELNTKGLERLTAKQKAPKNTHVVWSTVFATSNTQCCIPSSVVPARSTIVVTINKSGEAYTIQLNYVNVERRSVDSLALVDTKLTEKPIAFTLDPNDGRLTVLSETGVWSVFQLQLKYNSSKKLASQLVKQLDIPLKGYKFQDPILGKVAAITPLGDSYVAIIAPRTTSKNDEHVVSIWDVKYGTLQAEQIVKTTEKNTFSKNCVYSIAALPNSHLAITISSVDSQNSKKSGKSQKKVVDTSSLVMLCPYYSEPVSLMAALGKMKQTVAFMGISNEIKSSENIGFSRSGMETVINDVAFSSTSQEPEEIYKKWVSKVNSGTTLESNILAELLKQGITEKEFSRKFFEYVNVKVLFSGADDVNMSEASAESQTNQYRQWMVSGFEQQRKKEVELSQFFISSIISRFSSSEKENNIWPVDVLLYLISRSLVCSNYFEKGIIKTILERDEWSLVPIALETVKDIPENDLVTLIKALNSKTKEDNEEWNNERFGVYFKSVVVAPRNDVFLQQSLKRISATELPLILDTLAIWLNEKAASLENRSNIVDFCNSILDIHFPTLILEPTLQPIIQTLRELVSKEIEVVDDLEQMRNILGAYSRKHKHSRAKKQLEKQANKENMGAPQDELTRFRKKKNGKFGGEQGIPIYRVEVFKF